jgi:hypothetical protein
MLATLINTVNKIRITSGDRPRFHNKASPTLSSLAHGVLSVTDRKG